MSKKAAVTLVEEPERTSSSERPERQVTIELAPMDSTDLQLARLWRNDHRIWKWSRQNDLISDYEQARWFEKQAQDPSVKMYKILMQAKKEIDGSVKNPPIPVGICGFTSIDLTNRRAEFSIYIAPGFWGNRLGHAGLSTLLTHGFKNLGFHTIYGEVFDQNPALEVFVSMGFRIEGIRKEFYFRDGAFIDASLISITESEWKPS